MPFDRNCRIKKLIYIFCLISLFVLCGSLAYAREDVAPTGSIVIENTVTLSNGKKAIGTQNVTLNIKATDSGSGVSRIAIANENAIDQINWMSWTDSRLTPVNGSSSEKRISWTLSEGDGYKTVWLIIEDADSNTSVTYNDAYRYIITYNFLGGANGPATGRKEVGKVYWIPTTVPTKANYDCVGWDTDSSGANIAYAPGAGYYKNADITLYAVWYKNYTIVFNGHGNTGGSTANQHMTYSIAKPLNANGFTKTGYHFNVWTTNENGTGNSYSNQQTVNNLTSTAGGTVNLYAQWLPNTYTVTLNKNGGSGGTNSVTATYNAAMPTSGVSAPSRSGWAFNGYYDATSGGTQYYTSGMGSARTWNKASDATLYAQWSDVTSPSKPTITITTSQTGTSSSWYNTDVVVRITQGSDNESGVNRVTYSLSGATSKGETTISNNGTFTVTNAGTTTVTAYTYDNAGNRSAASTLNVNIDRTAPTLADIPSWSWLGSSVRADGANIDIYTGASDSGGSGLSHMSYSVSTRSGWTNVSNDGNGYAHITCPPGTDVVFQIKAVDGAGNESYVFGVENFGKIMAVCEGYNHLLGRSPEYTGMMHWFAVVNMGHVYRGHINSDECINSVRPSDEQYIRSLYKMVLGRTGEEAGVQGHVAGLTAAGGYTTVKARYNKLKEFIDSAEYQGIKNAWGFTASLDPYNDDTGGSTGGDDGGHQHVYNARYTCLSSSSHRAFCRCGASITAGHFFGTGNRCPCGYNRGAW